MEQPLSKVCKKTFDICKKHLNDILIVSNGQVCKTMIDLYQNDGIIAEPAGALSVAALDSIPSYIMKDKIVVAVISGGNNDITRYPEIT